MPRSGLCSTAVQSVVNGESFGDSLENQAVNVLIGAAGNLGAKAIGNAAHGDGTLANPGGKINKAQQLALHAGLGCGVAAAGGGDCASGAVSGVVGELTGEMLYQKGQGFSKEVSKELAGLAGGFSSVFTGNAVGLDDSEIAENIYSGQRIGKNAAENNALLFVHGTHSSPKQADPEFIEALEETFGEKVIQVEWSGDNTREARIEGAKNIDNILDDYEYKEGEGLHIVGHSHGGSVIKEFTQIYEGEKKINTMVLLGTPHRQDHILDYSDLGANANAINLYDRQDMVQIGGHSDGKTLLMSGFKAPFKIPYAQRTLEGFNNIEIFQTEEVTIRSIKDGYSYTYQQGIGPFDSHSLLDSKPVWDNNINNLIIQNDKHN